MNKIKDKSIGSNRNAISQAKEENSKAEKFLNLLNLDNILYEGLLEEPEPDVLLSNIIDNSKIGMELVSLNLDPIKRIESFFQQVLDDARIKFEGLDTLDLSIGVLVSFSNNGVLQLDPDNDFVDFKSIRSKIIDELVFIVYQFKKISLANEFVEYFNNLDFNSDYIDRVSITKVKNRNGCFWSFSGGVVKPLIQNVYFGKGSRKDLIFDSINKKIKKHLNYTVPYEEIWLLIYAKENVSSTLFNLDRFDYEKCYKTTYDKVYLMLEDKVILLNTKK